MSEISYQSINVGTGKISRINKPIDLDFEKPKSKTLKTAIIVPFIISTFVGSSPEIKGFHSEPIKLERKSSSVVPYVVSTKKAYRDRTVAPGRVVIDVEELMEHNKEKNELKGALKAMKNEIEKPVWNFENKVIWLGYLLSIVFLLLSLPFFLGTSSLVGSVGSLGLPIYVKIRRWERKNIG